MKKMLLIMMVVAMICALFSGCANKKDIDRDEKNQIAASEQTTATTTAATTATETTINKDATVFDYLPEPEETVKMLKEYFSEKGYRFDDWYVTQDDEKAFVESKNGTGGTLINYESGYCMLNLGNTANGANAVSWSTGMDASINIFLTTECGDAFEVLELLFVNCPESLKPTMSELKKVNEMPLNQVGASEYLDIESAGVYYRLNYCTKGNGDSLYLISVYKNAPNGWNG